MSKLNISFNKAAVVIALAVSLVASIGLGYGIGVAQERSYSKADVNRDGEVDLRDFSTFSADWDKQAEFNK